VKKDCLFEVLAEVWRTFTPLECIENPCAQCLIDIVHFPLEGSIFFSATSRVRYPATDRNRVLVEQLRRLPNGRWGHSSSGSW
jgi:hypothetical protein